MSCTGAKKIQVNILFCEKSAYRLLQAQKGLWTTEDNSSIWRKLWRLKASSKVLNLTWCALSGCLPTNIMIQQKQVTVLCNCPMCDGSNEMIMHALVLCHVARQYWKNVFPYLHLEVGDDFLEWLSLLNYLNPRKKC